MRKIVALVSLVISLVMLIAIGVIVLHVAGYDLSLRGLRVVKMNEPIGIESPSGKYRLVEMVDQTGQYVLYSIVQIEGEADLCPRTLFVTDDSWYHSRYISGAGWLNGTDDFYVDSSDVGRCIYRYSGNGWYSDFDLTKSSFNSEACLA